MSRQATWSAVVLAEALRPRRQLALIAAVLVLTMSTWFAASAVAPALRDEWSMSTGQATLLTTSVQLGFVVGAIASAVLNLPDIMDASRMAAASATLAAISTSGMALFSSGATSAVGFRLATGVALAGVYPVGMKLASSWFEVSRGLALGILIGALALGSALPQLIGGALASAWRLSLHTAAGLCLLGALISLTLIRVGPHTTPATEFRPSYVATLISERGPRLASLGYIGHMWELYAVWVWLPVFLQAGLDQRGASWSPTAVSVVSFSVIGICGGAGCLAAGWWGERIGRARVAAAAMIISGSCCLASAVLFGASPVIVVPVLAIWGASVIADSAMFSACLASVVDPRFVGTALTMQTAAGFTLTVLTIQGLPLVVEVTGWPVAIALLGVGPLAGAAAMLRLSTLYPVASQ